MGDQGSEDREAALRYLSIASLVLALSTGIRPGEAQTLSPYSDFQAMSPSELSTLQVKLTSVGARRETLSSVAFTSPSNSLDLAVFVPFRRSGIDYSNDDVAPPESFTATAAELKTVIDEVGTLPNVTAGGVASNPLVSFAMFHPGEGGKAFEAVLDVGDANDLFARLRVALGGHTRGFQAIATLACPLDLIGPERPTDVTVEAEVKLDGVRLDRHTGRFVGSLEVTNRSTASFDAPVSVIVVPKRNVRLANAAGSTCATPPVGAPFVDLPGAVASGQSARVALEFENPDLDLIEVDTLVLAGPGAR